MDEELKKLKKQKEAALSDTDAETPQTEVKKKKYKKKVEFAVEEIQEKLSLLFNAMAAILKIDKEYKPNNFVEESKDIVRLSQKYPFISSVLSILDPLSLILNLSKKFLEILKLKQKRDKASKKENEEGMS